MKSSGGEPSRKVGSRGGRNGAARQSAYGGGSTAIAALRM